MQDPTVALTPDAIQFAPITLLDNLDNLVFETIITGTLVDLQNAISYRIRYYLTQEDAINGFLHARQVLGKTMLYVAVTAHQCNDRINKIDWLISQGARVDLANQKAQMDNEFNCSPLLGAAFFGQFESLCHLIENYCRLDRVRNIASRLLFAAVCSKHTPLISCRKVMEYLIQRFQISPYTLVDFGNDLIEPLIVKIALLDGKDNIPLKIFLKVLEKLNIPIDLHHEACIKPIIISPTPTFFPSAQWNLDVNNFEKDEDLQNTKPIYTLPVLAAVLARGTAPVARYLMVEKKLNMERTLTQDGFRPIDFFYERVKELTSKGFTNDLSDLILILDFIPLLLDSPVFLQMSITVNSAKRSLLGYLLGDVINILFSQPNFCDLPNFTKYFDSYLQCVKAVLGKVYPLIRWMPSINQHNIIYPNLRSNNKSFNNTRAEFREITKEDPSNLQAYCIQGDSNNYFIALDVQKFNFESETIQSILLQKAQGSNWIMVPDSTVTNLVKKRGHGGS